MQVVKMKKIILVDGNNLLFRSFYATAYQGVIMKKDFPQMPYMDLSI